jgi:O-antigen ligase
LAHSHRSAAASAGLGALLAAAAFAAEGGNQLGRMASFEVAVLLGAGLVLALLFLRPRPWTDRGSAILLLFGAFAVLTALSTSWSIAPADSVQETSRTLAYLAALGLAVAAGQLRPRAPGVVAGAVLIAAAVVCGWSLLSRMFPAQLAENVLGARLGEPFDYWNALGAMAALAVPCALWLGSRREGNWALTALAYPAMGVLTLALALTQSRGALAAAVIAATLWLAIVPLRLRSLPLLALPALGVVPIASWALSKDAFTGVLEPLSSREAVAGDFGLMVLVLCAVLLGAGLALEGVRARRTPSLRSRCRAGVAVGGLACALALAGLATLAVSERGLLGTVSDRVGELTNENASTPGGAARLGSASSSRSAYWRSAGQIFEERPLLGRGANSFGLAHLRYRKDGLAAQHAHGFLAQTLADLGLIGVALAIALAAAWLTAAARATGLVPGRRRRPEWTHERTALVAVALSAFTFGLHSAIDWTWFVPGPAITALLAAGFVAGRGPLPASGARAAAAAVASTAPGRRLHGLLGAGRPGPGRAIAAAAVLATAALCAWAVWQPERAERATDRAYELLDEGDFKGASEQVLRARELDPYSPAPLFTTATVLAEAGRLPAAYQVLEQAVREHPRDPDTWLRLAGFELDRLDLPARAIESLAAASVVDPRSPRIPPLVARAQATLAIPLPPPQTGGG